jgi:hypothetical protein
MFNVPQQVNKPWDMNVIEPHQLREEHTVDKGSAWWSFPGMTLSEKANSRSPCGLCVPSCVTPLKQHVLEIEERLVVELGKHARALLCLTTVL